VWTSGSGAYAGISFNGTVISPDKSLNDTPDYLPGSAGPARQSGRRPLSFLQNKTAWPNGRAVFLAT
jgi:hypothetical protein